MLAKRKLMHVVQDTETVSAKKLFSFIEAKKIGEALGISWDKFGIRQFRMGLNIELEHGKRDPVTDVTHDDPMATGKIALAHLNDRPDYYTRLAAMEEEAEGANRGPA